MDDANDIYKILDYPLFFNNIDWSANQTNQLNFDQQKIPPSYHHPAPFQRRRSSSVDLPINPLYSNSNRLFFGANAGNNDYFSANHATIKEEPIFPTQPSSNKIGYAATVEFPNVMQQGTQVNFQNANHNSNLQQQQQQNNSLFIPAEDGSPSLSAYSASTNNDEHMISPPLSNKSSVDSHASPPTQQQQQPPQAPVQQHPFEAQLSIPPHPYTQPQQLQPLPAVAPPSNQGAAQQPVIPQHPPPPQLNVQPPMEEQQQQQAFTFFPELQRTSYNTYLGKQLRQHTKRRRSSSLPPAFHATSAAAVYNQQQQQEQQQQQRPPTQKLKNDKFQFVTIHNNDGRDSRHKTTTSSSASRNSSNRKHMPVIFTQIQVTDPTPVIHTQKVAKVVDARPIAIERIPNKKTNLLNQQKTKGEQDPTEKRKKMDEELIHLNFEDITVAELKDMLKERGLSCTGKKQVLVDRLKEERDKVVESANAPESERKEPERKNSNSGSSNGSTPDRQPTPMSTDEPTKPAAPPQAAAVTAATTISASPAIKGLANMTINSPKHANKGLFPPIADNTQKKEEEQLVHPFDTTLQQTNDNMNSNTGPGTMAGSEMDSSRADDQQQPLEFDNMDLFDFDMFNNAYPQDQQNMNWTPTVDNSSNSNNEWDQDKLDRFFTELV